MRSWRLWKDKFSLHRSGPISTQPNDRFWTGMRKWATSRRFVPPTLSIARPAYLLTKATLLPYWCHPEICKNLKTMTSINTRNWRKTRIKLLSCDGCCYLYQIYKKLISKADLVSLLFICYWAFQQFLMLRPQTSWILRPIVLFATNSISFGCYQFRIFFTALPGSTFWANFHFCPIYPIAIQSAAMTHPRCSWSLLTNYLRPRCLFKSAEF